MIDNKTELKDKDLEKVSGGRIILYGINTIYVTCPFCGKETVFRFAESGGGYAKGAQMGTCTCGAIIKAESGSTVKYEKDGVSIEVEYRD